MATDTRHGGMVTNYYNGGNYSWRCRQTVTTTVTNEKVQIVSTIAMLPSDDLHFYENDVQAGLFYDGNRVVYSTTSPDHYVKSGVAWNRITSHTVTYTRYHTASSHKIHGSIQVIGGAWEGLSTLSSTPLTVTIPAKPSYTITYDANGGSGAPGKGTKWYNEAFTVSSTKPTRSGYTFVNWKIKETGNTVGAGGTITANSNANYTLVAQWTANKAVISFNANGGTQSSTGAQNYPIGTTKITSNYNGTINLYNISSFGLSKTGYHTDAATAWNTKANDSGTSYNEDTNYSWTTFGSLTASQTNITLYANWKINSYTLTANANGGNIPSTSGWTGTGTQATKNVNYNATYGTLPEPTRPNYTFNGWYTAQTGGTKITTTTKMGTANTTIYAQWTRAYTPPKVKITAAKRASEINNNFEDDDEGVIPHIVFTWTSGDDAGTPIDPSTYDIKITEQVDTNPQEFLIQNQSLGDPPVSPVSVYLDDPNATINTSMSYDVEVKLHVNGHEDVSTYDYISQAFFIMDINANGTAIGFGGAVEDYIKTNDTAIVSNKAYYTLNIVDENKIYTQVAEPTAANLNNYYEVNKGLYLRDNNDVFRALFDFLYPVGSYYETSDSSFNPNVTWGGTWILEESGRVHVSAGTGYTLGSTGGSKDAIIPYHRHGYNAPPSKTDSTTLTTSQIPAHTHGSKTLVGNANFRKWTTGKMLTYTDGIFSASEPTTSATSVESSGTNPNKVDRLTVTATHEHTSVGGGGGHTHNITASASNTDYVGTSGNLTNANMQPYIVVNRWHRTA